MKQLSNLKAELARRGISNRELSEHLGLHENSLRNKLKGFISIYYRRSFLYC